MNELIYPKIIRKKDEPYKRINFNLICPTCKLAFNKCFNICNNASEKEVKKYIDGQAEILYYEHVLDCK